MVVVADPVADLITRLKNASMVKGTSVEVPHSNIKERIAKKLEQNGYIHNVQVKGDKKTKRICIEMPYDDLGRCPIHNVKRVSKLSKRIYISAKHIYPYKNGRGIAVLSTPSGILTDVEARKQNVGGEVLFYIW